MRAPAVAIPGSPAQLALAVIVAGILFAPVLRSGFVADDHVVVAAVEGTTPHRLADASEVYRFATGRHEEMKAAIHRGDLAWWNSLDHVHAYWRPLTSLTYRIDLALFGRWPAGWFLHGFVWYAGLIVLVGLLLARRAPSIATLALALFVLCDVHAGAATWNSARHHIMSMVLALGGLLAHLRWREERWRAGAWLGPLLAGMSLLCSESGLQALGYLLAYELVSPGRWRDRARALLPTVLVVVTYLVAYKAQGYGIRNYGNAALGYADPFRAPGQFLWNALQKLPYYLSLAFAGALRRGYDAGGPRRWLMVGLPIAAASIPLVLAGLRALPQPTRRAATWLVCGGLLALIPAFATQWVSDEAFFVPSLGGVTALAVVSRWLWMRARAPGDGAVRAGAAAALTCVVAIHGLLAPAYWLGVGVMRTRFAATLRAPFDGLALPPTAREVILFAGLPQFVMLGGGLNALPDRPGPQVLRVVSPDYCDHGLKRLDARTFLLSAYAESARGDFYWPRKFVVGEEIDAGPIRIRIVSVDAGVPRVFHLTFDRDPADPSLAYLVWKDGRLLPLELPRVGETRYVTGRSGSLVLPRSPFDLVWPPADANRLQ